METFLWMALLSLLTGITYIAYKHPPGYRKIYIVLGLAFGLAGIFDFFWSTASNTTFKAVRPYIAPDKAEAALVAAKAVQIPLWVSGMIIGVAAYLVLLAFLPQILGMPSKNDDQIDR